ncbi:hypothetical protein BD410DRAFT_782138 [Rickenella mellea]|uniref:Uncharacterized protein n=1 Tax=Rickenella mellea TaxID=50990 RepID=A0A4Y7QM83_9AGAM|nr:hypothetical protein BD410DRAFT_782138 [Rickenella mellea]
MFARFSQAASHFLDIPLIDDHTELTISQQDPLLVLNVDVSRLPTPENAIRSVAGFCNATVFPLCRYLETTLTNDFETLALLHEIDQDVISNESPPENSPLGTLLSDASEPHQNTCGEQLIPKIVVTLAPPQPREASCWIPLQDSSFGMRLTVPSHALLNATHPPMVAAHAKYNPYIRSWKYERGHWKAVVPALDEQQRRGIFSRPSGLRRRLLSGRFAAHPEKTCLPCRDVWPIENRRKS